MNKQIKKYNIERIKIIRERIKNKELEYGECIDVNTGEIIQSATQIDNFFREIKGDDGNYTIVRKFKYDCNGVTDISNIVDRNHVDCNVSLNFKNNRKYRTGKTFFNRDFKELYGFPDMFFSINSFYCGDSDRGVELTTTKNGKSFRTISNTRKNIASINAIVLDVDFKENLHLKELSDSEIIELVINSFPIKPTYITRSGNGCHIYYNLVNENLIGIYGNVLNKKIDIYKRACITTHNALLLNNIKCDNAVTGDISRVIRIPLTYNYKDRQNPKLVKIIYYNSIITKINDYVNTCRIFHSKNRDKIIELKQLDKLPKIKNIKKTESTIKIKKTYDKNYSELQSKNTIANKDYPRRATKKTNIFIFNKNLISDIDYLVEQKNYDGRRNNILFLLCGIINKNNSSTNKFINNSNDFDFSNGWEIISSGSSNKSTNFNINKQETLLRIGRKMNLPISEIKKIIELKHETTITKGKLRKLLGINKIDETWLWNTYSSSEIERRKQIRYAEHNKKYNSVNNAKYNQKYNSINNPINNPINNAKVKEKRKTDKQLKIDNENKIISELINQNKTTIEISNITGFSTSKINRIKSRL